jgi:ABC-type nitrate/sulfonate/bicarbonate transport system substrate-binding protein
MSNEFIKNHPDAPQKLMNSFVDSYDFYRQNVSQANKRFVTESKLNISDSAFKTCSDIEPNVSAKSKKDIRVTFTESDLKSLQNASDFLYNQ